MSPRARVVTFRADNEDLIAMETLKRRHGVPYSEQIRRALKAWVTSTDAANMKNTVRRVANRQL